MQGKGEIKTYWLIDAVEVHRQRISEHDEKMRCPDTKVDSLPSVTIFGHSPLLKAKLIHHSSGVLRGTPDGSPLEMKKAMYLRNFKEKSVLADASNELDMLPLLNKHADGQNGNAIL